MKTLSIVLFVVVQFDDRYEASSWFDNEPHGIGRNANEDWVSWSPNAVMCDGNCQKVRPFKDVE